jgi:isopentenyldiphosphate isomerase
LVLAKNNDGVEVLVQQRAKQKTWGGKLDVTAAGHILFSESPIDAAIRELSEELGVRIHKKNFELVATMRDTAPLVDGRSKNEHRWVYTVKVKKKPRLLLQESEVSAAFWMKLDDFCAQSRSNIFADRGELYWRIVCTSLMEKG